MQKSDKPGLPGERVRGSQYWERNGVLSSTMFWRVEGKKDLKPRSYLNLDEYASIVYITPHFLKLWSRPNIQGIPVKSYTWKYEYRTKHNYRRLN